MSGTVDDPMLLAAEYALGSLDLAEMRQAEAEAARDSAFAAEILFWQERLSPLNTAIAPVEPPAALWARLALATGIRTTAQPRSGSGFWKASTALSLAIAASLALFAFLPRPPVPAAEPPRFAAALAPLTSPARFLAVARPDGSIAVTGLAAGTAGPGRDYQLWALPRGATTPVSLGVLPPGGKVVQPAQRPADQEQLLVSDEPTGGSPTGQPTGTVMFGGTLVPLSPGATPGP